MDIRKEPLVTEKLYHVYNKSIAGYKIFNRGEDYMRMIKSVGYYQFDNVDLKFSRYLTLLQKEKNNMFDFRLLRSHVNVIAYCIMPTHVHFILEQVKDNGISLFMSNVQNAYARYFNIKHNRKGPLWVGKFKNVLVKTDDQLMHLTRYLHLNPVTAYLVDKPEKWFASSYLEYIKESSSNICNYSDFISIEAVEYKKFVEDSIDYQRNLADIKKLTFE